MTKYTDYLYTTLTFQQVSAADSVVQDLNLEALLFKVYGPPTDETDQRPEASFFLNMQEELQMLFLLGRLSLYQTNSCFTATCHRQLPPPQAFCGSFLSTFLGTEYVLVNPAFFFLPGKKRRKHFLILYEPQSRKVSFSVIS